MEEGVPPLPPRPGSRPSSAPDQSNGSSAVIVPLVPATYIVQAPKDQIFRIPPPENALYVEQYRSTIKNRRRVPACCSWVAKGLAVALLVLIVCLVAALVFYLVVKPTDPSFSVKDVVVVAVGGPHAKNPEFSIALTAKNPSAKMGYFFEKGGKARLSSDEKSIASGVPPAFDVQYRSSEDFKVVLGGSKAELPEKVKKSLKGSKDVVSLTLSVEFPVRSAIAGVKLWMKQMNAVCDFRVINLMKGTRIVSQSCEAKFR